VINVTFYGREPEGFAVSGHSGLADSGSDILCAAVTSAVRLTETLINDTLYAQADVNVEEETAAITLRLQNQPNKEAVNALVALRNYLKQLASEYPGHISVRTR